MNICREVWDNYRGEFFFFCALMAATVLSHWLSRFIPVDMFENLIILIQHAITLTLSLLGAWWLFSHADGMRIRKLSALALLVWGLSEVFFMVQTVFLRQQVLVCGSEALSVYMLFVGNFLGWLLLLYPTETLRPGWMNGKIALFQLLPMALLCGLDYLVPWDLRWLISLYPLVLFSMVLSHIRAYRLWCENNYSSMEHIDVQWVVRYLIMLMVLGGSYAYMIVSDNPCRAFTQNLLLQFMFAYSVEQILFRKNPWEGMSTAANEAAPAPEEDRPESVQRFEQWMETDKPYLNPDFKLMDLRAVLPMNRTYLSQFVNTTYGCTFFLLVNRYRIEEAKRLMRDCPEMKLSDVAAHCGFSSLTVFSAVFAKATGLSPREWSKQNKE